MLGVIRKQPAEEFVAMRLRCPNCRTDLDIVPAETALEVKCPSCGSVVDISGLQETITYTPPKLGKLAHFELLEHIGRGHFGDVYKASDSRLERIVALKIPRSADLGLAEREAFYREARTAARLRHPNIVTVHDVNSVAGTLYIASELIDGINLADRLSGKPLAPRQAAELAAKIADALQHAHEQGVIHRDLKPRNIMLDAAGEPHVLDFGLAKRDAAEFTITAEGEILGTPAYMAPEQARGQAGTADARTDVYSLGVTLYEMLTGTRPFLGDARGLIYQVLHDEPAPPRKLEKDVPRDLETICLKAMAKEPGRRYQTAGKMAADLKQFLAGEPIQARRAGIVERSWRWCRRNPAWFAAGGLALTVIALATYVAVALTLPPAGNQRVGIDVRLAQGAFQSDSDPRALSAEVLFWLLDRDGKPSTLRPHRVRGKPPLYASLPAGEYFVVALVDDGRFHEVFRRIPDNPKRVSGRYRHNRWDLLEDGTIQLPEVTIPLPTVTSAMVPFRGSDSFQVGDASIEIAPPHRRKVPAFFLDPLEVSIADFRSMPHGDFPKELAGKPANQPLTFIDFDEALAWAEFIGKRLPTEVEYEFAATQGGTSKYPWGNDWPIIDEWPLAAVGEPTFDRTKSLPQVAGLYSNVGEWTLTWFQVYPRDTERGFDFVEPRDHRMLRGIPSSVLNRSTDHEDWADGPAYRIAIARSRQDAAIGFRCARSQLPHRTAGNFESVVSK